MSSVPGSGRSPGGGSGNPLQDSCLENFRAEESGGLQSMEWQRVRYEWATEPTYVCKTYTYMHTHVHISTYQYLPSTLSICLSIYIFCVYIHECIQLSYLWLDIYIVGLNQSLMDFYHRVRELNEGERKSKRRRRRRREKSLWFYCFYCVFPTWVNKARTRSTAWKLESSNHSVLKKINEN